MGPGFLAVKQITKQFTDREGHKVLALENISLDVSERDFVALVGPSGCGKSTLLHIIAGLPPYFRPDSGEVQLEGRAVTGPGKERGMVFQEYALLPWETVMKNVAFGLELQGWDKAECCRQAEHYIDLVGLGGFEHKFPHQLSGGMRQRVAVARALCNKPKVLLMDEPFAAVDAQTRMTLQEELTNIWEREHTTVLFVTHSVEEAVFLANRVVVLGKRPGRVIDDKPVNLQRPRVWSTMQNNPEFGKLVQTILARIFTPASDTKTDDA